MADPLPEWAYVPGQTPRHPDGAFDAFKADAASGLTSDTARLAVVWMQAGFFWETHELLEAVWMALPDGTPEKRLVQAAIQLANAYLKARMGRPNATARLCEQIETLLQDLPPHLALPGLTQSDVRHQIATLPTP
jgi:hypothetical protein